MNRYEAVVRLKVTIEAYDDADAKDMLEDAFGPGDDCGVTIRKYEVTKFEPAS